MTPDTPFWSVAVVLWVAVLVTAIASVIYGLCCLSWQVHLAAGGDVDILEAHDARRRHRHEGRSGHADEPIARTSMAPRAPLDEGQDVPVRPPPPAGTLHTTQGAGEVSDRAHNPAKAGSIPAPAIHPHARSVRAIPPSARESC